MTLRLPEKVGELASISSSIAEAGGNIVAVTSSRLMGESHREVTIKEKGADPNVLTGLLSKSGLEIVDIRASSRYQPKMFG
jgi:hypothetical protein